jgi:hypothetical protein
MTQEMFQQLVSVIREEVGGLEKRFDAKLDEVKLELKQDIADVRTELKQDIADVHARIDIVHKTLTHHIGQAQTAVLETQEQLKTINERLGLVDHERAQEQKQLVRLKTRFERHEAGNRERFTTLNGRLRQVERRWRPRRRLVR